MEFHGRIQNGAIALDGNPMLPEGAEVTVLIPAVDSASTPTAPKTEIVCEPGKLPYVRGGEPGSLHLTNERIYEILDEEEIEAVKRSWHAPS